MTKVVIGGYVAMAGMVEIGRNEWKPFSHPQGAGATVGTPGFFYFHPVFFFFIFYPIQVKFG